MIDPSTLPSPNFTHGTGATPLRYDWRDRQAVRRLSIAAALATFPDTLSLRRYQIGAALDQGQTSACVPTSTCHWQAFAESVERKRWFTFDWARFYAELGGTGLNGIGTRDTLQAAQAQGCPVLNSNGAVRYKLASYAFIDFGDFDAAIQIVKATISTGRPVLLAMLLPDDFANPNGQCGLPSSHVTGGYHQVLLGGYSPSGLDVFNSWGPYFADSGWTNISISFLARPEQQGYLYGATAFDAVDDDVPPPDPKPTPLSITGFVNKANLDNLRITPDSDASKLKGKRVTVQEIVK